MWIKYINHHKQEGLMELYGVMRNHNNLIFTLINGRFTDWSMWGNIDMDKMTEEDAIRNFIKIEEAVKNGIKLLDLTNIIK